MSDSLKQEGDSWVLRFERALQHPPEKVWRVLTEPEELAHWYPSAIEGERNVGAALRFVFAGSPGPAQTGEMRVFDPPRVLEYTWAEETLRWEIVAAADGKSCTLLFTHVIRDRSTAPRSAAGWDLCIDRMRAWLDESDAVRVSWPERYKQYSALFGSGDFPRFMRADRVEGALGTTAGVESYRFAAPDGSELITWRAGEDAETPMHRYDREVYLLVVEGAFMLRIGGGELELTAGREFHFPPGLPIAGFVTAGTRGLLGIAGSGA